LVDEGPFSKRNDKFSQNIADGFGFSWDHFSTKIEEQKLTMSAAEIHET